MASITRRTTSFGLEHPGAGLQPGDKTLGDRAKDALRALYPRPTTGRTGVMGRRAEKPGKDNASGPSGQPDSCWHDSTHTNK
jgi:hypothetical protein